MTRKKVRHLSVRLLKQEVSTPEAALKGQGQVKKLKLKKVFNFTGTLFIPPSPSKYPKWLDLLQSGMEDKFTLLSQSAAALLILETGEHHFALAFGHGRHLLQEDAVERDFGLKVALNAIDPDDLRSVDMQTLEELTLHTRRQVSRGSPLGVFGLDVTRDVMRGVTGRPRDQGLARQLTGADAVAFNVPIDFSELGAKCQQLLEISQKGDYKSHFGFIDHLKLVRDRRLIAELDQKLVESLRGGPAGTLYLAPPRLIDWQRFVAFSYSSDPAEKEYGDLELGEYLKTVDRKQLTIEDLKQDRVEVKYADEDTPGEHWSLYESIVHEVSVGQELYSLSAGDWFLVDATFASGIREQIKSIPASTLSLPAATAQDDEWSYNQRVAHSVPGLVLMDRQLIKPEDAATPIEFCDLFSSSRMLIHVKAKNRSSTLSHLFAQSVGSAETFLWDEKFRKEVKRRLTAAHHSSHAALVPIQRPEAKDFEIVYGIITKPTKTWPLSLPFLSQLNLANTVRRLKRHGYKVSLLRIDHP
jgi:uncharacterized protein (TIGR04141 family)